MKSIYEIMAGECTEAEAQEVMQNLEKFKKGMDKFQAWAGTEEGQAAIAEFAVKAAICLLFPEKKIDFR